MWPQETKRSSQRFFDSSRSVKVIFRRQFAGTWPFEDLRWNHVTSTHRPETKWYCRAGNRGTSAVRAGFAHGGRFHMSLLSAHRSGPLFGRENSFILKVVLREPFFVGQ